MGAYKTLKVTGEQHLRYVKWTILSRKMNRLLNDDNLLLCIEPIKPSAIKLVVNFGKLGTRIGILEEVQYVDQAFAVAIFDIFVGNVAVICMHTIESMPTMFIRWRQASTLLFHLWIR
jgi:hypothetical protein